MSRLALLVGINRYESADFESLTCCIDDALAMQQRLQRHASLHEGEPGERNYQCRTLTSETGRITRDTLERAIDELLGRQIDGGELLFYFSGHGISAEDGGYLVTQEGDRKQPGYPMARLLEAANNSRNLSVIIILDCCHSGQIGNVEAAPGVNTTSIGANVTVLAASSATEKSSEGMRNSLFTGLLLEALDGGAADVCGEISAAAAYAYIEQALGPWEQRPVYKSYARRLPAIRRCRPLVDDAVLARLTDWFFAADDVFAMDPSFEHTEATARPENVAVFKQFKLLRDAGLLKATDGDDLYFTAINSGNVHLTPQGRLMWKRARRGDF